MTWKRAAFVAANVLAAAIHTALFFAHFGEVLAVMFAAFVIIHTLAVAEFAGNSLQTEL